MENQPCQPQRTYEINFDEAVKLVHNFLYQSGLADIARDKAIGGIMHKASLQKKNPFIVFQGQMAWFCMPNDTNSTYPKFFLAFEDGEYDCANVPSSPKSAKLILSREILTFSQPQPSISDVENFLKSKFKIPTNPDGSISRQDCEKILSHVGADLSNNHYNKYFCGFFENRGLVSDEYSNFIDSPDLIYVAYFFGFDDSTDDYKNTNRIRIILMALDGNGQLLPAKKGLTNAPRILQASWPPPPNN